MRVLGSLALLTLVAAVPADAGVGEAIARGDSAWSRRAQSQDGARASAEAIGESAAAYEEAMAADPENLAARWKLLRTLYFQGEYLTPDRDAKLAIYVRGRELADESRQLLARKAGADAKIEKQKPQSIAAAVGEIEEAAELYFWSAAHWGLWGRHRGKIAAARQGVAGKIRDFSEVVILLDETVENAGGHRILGRLHSEAPKLPFFTGWIDRKKAVTELERAVELAPDDLLSRLYLAEALLEYDKTRRDEALELLADLVTRQPDPDYLVEGHQVLRDARLLLAEWQDD